MKRNHNIKVDESTYETIRLIQGEFIRTQRKHISMLEIIKKKFNNEC